MLDGVERRVVDVAGRHQDGVVRPVEAGVEVAQLGRTGRQQLLARAEHLPAVGVGAEQARVHRHLQGVPRLAVVHGDLFEDHLALARHLLGVEGEGRHAVGLDGERLGPAVGGKVEVIGRRVVAGEGVVDPAQGLGQPVDLAGAEAAGPLEHHVLEEMGGAAVPRRLVAGAGPVEQSGGDDRRLRVGEQADGQPVVEPVEVEPPGERLQLGQRQGGGDVRTHPPNRTMGSIHRHLPE
jgi:hypothetical protein